MNGKPWTQAELDYLARHYGIIPTEKIEAALKRSCLAIRYKASNLGLSFGTWVTRNPEKVEKIKELNAKGFCDDEISKEIGCHRRMVVYCRAKFLLPSRRFGSRHRAKMKAVADARTVDPSYAKASGWPESLKIREVQVLNVLAASDWTVSCADLAKNLGVGATVAHCYLRSLMSAGLVARISISGQKIGYVLGAKAVTAKVHNHESA